MRRQRPLFHPKGRRQRHSWPGHRPRPGAGPSHPYVCTAPGMGCSHAGCRGNGVGQPVDAYWRRDLGAIRMWLPICCSAATCLQPHTGGSCGACTGCKSARERATGCTGAVLKLPPERADVESRGERCCPCAVTKLSGLAAEPGGMGPARGCGGAVCIAGAVVKVGTQSPLQDSLEHTLKTAHPEIFLLRNMQQASPQVAGLQARVSHVKSSRRALLRTGRAAAGAADKVVKNSTPCRQQSGWTMLSNLAAKF